MRKKQQKQMPLIEPASGHPQEMELENISLLIDCVILEGNPADTDLVEQMLDRQKQIYGRYPLKVALDGGFPNNVNNLTVSFGDLIK